MLTSDKIELPQKILDLIKKKDDNEPKKGRFLTFYEEIKDYLKFFQFYCRENINIVEIIYLLRPLIYLTTMIIFKKKSFVPLLFNVLMDFIILKVERKEKRFEGQRAYYCEYAYRLSRISIYLLREPIFSFLTKPFVRKLMKILRLPSFITNLVMVLLSYYTNLYFIL